MVGLLWVGGRAGSPAGVPNRADHAGAVGARRHAIRVSFATTGRDRRPAWNGTGRRARPVPRGSPPGKASRSTARPSRVPGRRSGLEALVDVADQERQAVLE